MNVSFFLGVRESYLDEARAAAESCVEKINAELSRLNVLEYADPVSPPDPYDDNFLFGRSALDHDTAGALQAVARAASKSPQLNLLNLNSCRVVFVPWGFATPILTDHSDELWGEPVPVFLGSLPTLIRELIDVAPLLGIPLTGEELTDDMAMRIRESSKLTDGDSLLYSNERLSWLLLFEGARLSTESGVALSLAVEEVGLGPNECSPMEPVSLLEFARFGRFGSIELGASRLSVRETLGFPNSWFGPTRATATIWTYSEIEFHFVSDSLCMIHTDHGHLNSVGQECPVDPWVVELGLDRAHFERALRAEGVAFTVPPPSLPNVCIVVTSAKAKFWFTEGADPDPEGESMVSGLCAWSIFDGRVP